MVKVREREVSHKLLNYSELSLDNPKVCVNFLYIFQICIPLRLGTKPPQHLRTVLSGRISNS